MELRRERYPGRYPIKGYEPGLLRIHENTYSHPIIVSPNYLISPWDVPSFDQLAPQHFKSLIALKPEIVLLGTGLQACYTATYLLELFIAHHIAFEIMHTAAACRTYSVLMSEGKHVAAALFP